MLTAIIFIIVLGILILVHELGHFIFAKRAGMTVEEFGFGFPPRLWSIKKGGTVYSINLIPFGGYVKILGEDGEEKNKEGSFSSKSIWQRFVVISAGVVMNLFLAIEINFCNYYQRLRQLKIFIYEAHFSQPVAPPKTTPWRSLDRVGC